MPDARRSRIALSFLVLAVAFLGATLIGRTHSRGDDFLVFHRVAQRFWDGVRPYDSITFGNMVFKYPPWILPFFLPFGLLDLSSAKTVWGLIEAISLVAVVTRLSRGWGAVPAVRPWVQALLLLSLYALFGSHGMTGQITLPMLAIALWVDPLRAGFGRFFLLVWALSAKMTSLFPLVHAWRRRRLALSLWGCFALFIALSLPVYFGSYDRHYKAMKVEWTRAMFSGTEDVNRVRIGFTTREAQGLPSLILRKSGLDEKVPSHVLIAIAISTVGLAIAWLLLSRGLALEAQWLGWLALLPATQALAWFHVFLFAYPMLAVGAEVALRRGDRRSAWAFLGCALLMGAVTTKTLGAIGAELEMASVKLWGVLLGLALFRKALSRTRPAGGSA